MSLLKPILSALAGIHSRVLAAVVLLAAGTGCRGQEAPSVQASSPLPGATKVGVLLVNHGSRSKTWRDGLLDLEFRVKRRIMEGGAVSAVRTAFMEYTEPSIATQLKRFDDEGYTDIILVPVFLTVSSHSFDDIPTIVGTKRDPLSLQTLKLEGIERYTPRARAFTTPLLDFGDVLQRNVLRRARALSRNPEEEAIVLVAYGDKTYERQWSALLSDVQAYVSKRLGVTRYAQAWCGHLVHYDPARTTEAILQVLEDRQRAIVIPILVAHDEQFQIKIIGSGIEAVEDSERRVVYRPDAILPDANIESWVIEVVARSVARLGSADGGS